MRKKTIHIIYFVIFMLFSGSDFLYAQAGYTAVSGKLDLSTIQTENEWSSALNGEWEFYWNELLTPDEFQKKTQVLEPEKIVIPGQWNSQTYKGKKMPRDGFLTMRLHIQFDENPGHVALKLPIIFSSYKIWINNKLLNTCGTVADNIESFSGQYKPEVIEFMASGNQLEIVIQISNYIARQSGIFYELILGKEKTITENRIISFMKDMFLIGALSIIGMHHLFTFLFRRVDKSNLYFSIICFLFVFLNTLFGENIFATFLFPNIYSAIYLKVFLLSYFLAPPFFLLFFNEIYPQEFPFKTVKKMLILWILLALAIVVAPTHLTAYTAISNQLYLVFLIGYILKNLIACYQRKRLGIFWVGIGVLILCLTVINDVLYYNGLVSIGTITTFGLLGMVFSHSVFITKRHNIFLEQTVDIRTRDLNLSMEKLEVANKKVMDSIEYAQRIQNSILPRLDEFKKILPKSFVYWQPRDIVGGDFYFIERYQEGFIIAVVDCTGHGVPGAFMTMIAATALKRITEEEKCMDPAIILKRLNQLVKETLRQDSNEALSDDGLDASICYINPSEKTLIFAGAKSPILLVNNKKHKMIHGDRKSIGYKRSDPNFQFHPHRVSINQNMSFYMFTDGITSQIGSKKRVSFGKNQLARILESASEKPFEQQVNEVINTFNSHIGENEVSDDITLLGFKVDC